MPTYTQANRPVAIKTPLGQDVLLLTSFRGHEGISQLFDFQAHLLAEAAHEIHFDRIVGQNVTVEICLAKQEKRYFNGLVKRFSQGGRDETFVHFSAEIVPNLWLLTKKVRSRIFQQLSVPDILRQLFAGLDVSYELSATYYQRDYCVQYRETDFNFASRLMEEEGIYYVFRHGDGSHQMVVTDVATQHPTMPGQSTIIYDEVTGGGREDMRITAWEKSQELRSGKYTLWDHCFELPDKHLEAKRKTTDSVTVGKVTHKLSVGGNDQLEIYDYPGGYAQRFDGVDRNGAARPQDLQDIFPDSERIVKVRMEEEAVASLEIRGASNCGQFVAGHRFTLKRHFDADGQYLLTCVEHDAHLEGNYRSDQTLAFTYENRFACIPDALPYRPQRMTNKPVIAGIQTATVVGPQGEEIFCDKYGRVKVQFHWDREGKKDANSSCWLRVAQVWAGKGWGAFFWPRIGHEVVAVFEEGDPDQPLIIGSVYNAENMPWFTLPLNSQLAGFKSASVRGTAKENFNGIVFDDKKGHEHLAFHSERDMEFNAEFDKIFHAGRNKGERVAVSNVFTVGHFPGSGGSGGGPASVVLPNVSQFGAGTGGGPFVTPDAQGALGHNLSMVLGENLESFAGINNQMTFGSNLQIAYNPLGLLAGVKVPGVAALLGSGVGGNMQLTVGTNVQACYGQNIEINCGPEKLELNNKADPASIILCGLLGSAITVFMLAYHHFESDQDRTKLALGFQVLIDCLIIALVAIAGVKEQEEKKMEKVRQALFGEKKYFTDSMVTIKKLLESPEFQGILAALIVGSVVHFLSGEKGVKTPDNNPPPVNNAPGPNKGGGPGGGPNKGGGSGGGPDSHNKRQSADGVFSIVANQVEIAAQLPLPPAIPEPFLINIVAAGTGMDGLVNLRGSQGVRVTAGPPPLPPTASDSTNGVEIVVGETQNVTIQRGLLPIDQKVEMTPSGITVDAGMGTVKIQSLTQITLSVAGGLSTITLGPEGVTVQGLMVKIN